MGDIHKEIIDVPSEIGNEDRPRKGDTATVHYVGRLEDGTEFDSSTNSDPLVFRIGDKEVIEGWDLAIPTMVMGEVAKFTFPPKYAYGEKGKPPTIPPHATLTFEITLVSWLSKDDLFGDGGVIRKEIKRGWGKESPTDGD